MSLIRFIPQLSASYRLLAARPLILLRVIVPWFLLVVAAHLMARGTLVAATWLPFVLIMMGMGGFGALWLEFAVTGRVPSLWPRIGFRTVGVMLALQVLSIFEHLPAPFIAAMFGEDPQAETWSQLGVQIFQVLVGPMFLLLPHILLWRRDEPGPRLPELVIAGGIPLGFGYVLSQLPFLLLTPLVVEIVQAVPAETPSVVLVGLELIPYLLQMVGVAVLAAYFGLSWAELRKAGSPRAMPG